MVVNGTLPVLQKIQRNQITSSGAAPAQSITSTAGLRHAGAKKWVTVARSLCWSSEKMRSAGRELVLEVMTASLATRASISAKMRRLSLMFSVAASITQSQALMAS